MKYQGGKYMIGKHISNILLSYNVENLNGYIEPFCGALGVLKHMTPHFKKCYAYDIHSDLIELWKQVKNNEFKPPESMSEKKYLEIKNIQSPSALKAFVGFGCSFGGVYFGGYAQKYTGGKNENYLQAATNSMKKLQPLIKNVNFNCTSYSKLRPKNKLIYCDPPYQFNNFPVKYRNDTKKYDLFDHDKFWDIMRKWSQNNLVIISEFKAPADFICIWKKEKYQSASQSKKTRYKSKNTKKYLIEKLFIHNSIFDKYKK